MSEELVQKLVLEVQTLRQDLRSLMTAVMGDPKFKVDGMQQHIDQISDDLDALKKDVHSLKTDRIKIVAWVSGIAAGCSVAGTKMVEWLRS